MVLAAMRYSRKGWEIGMRRLDRRILSSFTGMIALICFTFACASTGTITVRKPLAGPLHPVQAVAVEVRPAPRGWQPYAAQLGVEVAEMLKSYGIAITQVPPAPAQQDVLVLRMTVQAVRDVTHWERSMTGAFAGRGHITVDADLIDARTSDTLSSITVVGVTSGGTVLAGTTPQAVTRAAEQIAQFVSQNVRQASPR